MAELEHTFNKDGVKINGAFIKYDTDIADIKPSVVEVLSSQTATNWSVFLLHRAIAELGKQIDRHRICPINSEGIEKIARKTANEEIAKQPSKIWGKGIERLKDIIVILTIISLIIALLNK